MHVTMHFILSCQRHGTGELTRPDGSHYLGGWIGDEITGKGCMTYSNGDYYDGVWFKNLVSVIRGCYTVLYCLVS